MMIASSVIYALTEMVLKDIVLADTVEVGLVGDMETSDEVEGERGYVGELGDQGRWNCSGERFWNGPGNCPEVGRREERSRFGRRPSAVVPGSPVISNSSIPTK